MPAKLMSPKRLYLFTNTISVLLIFMTGLLLYLGNKLAMQQAPLVDSSIELKLDVTTEYLWLGVTIVFILTIASLLLSNFIYKREVHKSQLPGTFTEASESTMLKLEIEHDLRDAIKHDQFELHFHPQWQINSGSIYGLEALVRWQHPHRGLLFPDEFIPVAESCGLILALDSLILSKSLEQCKRWKEQGVEFGRIAVNVSSISFQQPVFLAAVIQSLTDFDVPGKDIEFEITESFLVENSKQSQNILSSLNKLGIQIAIDDFGTGYSSMSYLKHFSIQTLKIDRSFISDYNRDKVSAVILKNIVTLGIDLNMNIIAEGIETKEQEDHLRELGCHIGQGYYLTKPVPAKAMEEFLVINKPNNIHRLQISSRMS